MARHVTYHFSKFSYFRIKFYRTITNYMSTTLQSMYSYYIDMSCLKKWSQKGCVRPQGSSSNEGFEHVLDNLEKQRKKSTVVQVDKSSELGI